MKFTEEKKKPTEVPYFEDARASDGWIGQGTRKNSKQLKSEVGEAIGLLGGFVSHYQDGTYEIDGKQRAGIRIYYALEGVPSRIDIAALPVRHERNRKESLEQALFIIRDALKGMALFQKLSPGFAALIPFMLDGKGSTLSEKWLATSQLSKLLPTPDAKFYNDGGEEEIITVEG